MTNKLENVKIEGHTGTWYSLGNKEYIINGKAESIHLFEHETFGDGATCVFANEEGKLFMENVHNGWDDWKEYFLEEQNYNRSLQPLVWAEIISI